MKNAIRLLIKKNLWLLRAVASLFFDRKYLKGKCFEVRLDGWWWVATSIVTQKIVGINRGVPWPTSPFCDVGTPAGNIVFDVDDIHNFQTRGCYFQCINARIVIGRGTYIAANVGIITTNHDWDNLDAHLPGADVVLGESCWIGMNSVILPGVLLGPHTIVGAGSVVTKSFPEGNLIIAGNPAKEIRKLSKSTSPEGPSYSGSGPCQRAQGGVR